MSKVLVESTNLTNIANSIRTKNGTSDTYTPSQMSTAIDNLPTGSGNIVNGIIEQYKAETSTIDANTFVEFVNKTTIDNIGTDTQISSGTNAYYYASAVYLGDNKVFLAHRNNYSLYGIVCTISGTTIITGTDTQIVAGTSSNTTYDYASAVKLTNSKIFIAHKNGDYLYGIVCTIENTTITAGTDTKLSTASTSYQYASVVALNDTKIFIAHRNSSYLYGIICEINDTTITAGTDTKLSTQGNSYYFASAVALNNNKFFIAHRGGNYLYGIICTIEGTSITYGTDTVLVQTNNAYNFASAVYLGDDKTFVAHGYNNGLYGIICIINGTTITTGTDTQIASGTSSYTAYDYTSAIVLNKNKIFIAHRKGGSTNGNYLSGIICTIDGTTITAGTDTELNTTANLFEYVSTVYLGGNKIFIAHKSDNTNNYLNGVICISKNTIQQSKSTIDGITKTECTTSTAGDVWVLGE